MLNSFSSEKTNNEKIIFNYDELVENYHNNLISTLRGFGKDFECFSSWVPDEDPIRSITCLIDSVKLAGMTDIYLQVNHKIKKIINEELIKNHFSSFGKVSIKENDLGLLISIEELNIK